MLRPIIKKQVVHYALVTFSLLALAVPCYGGVIFEDNFDSSADWNTSRQYEGAECSVGACASSTYPANWNFYRSVAGGSGFTNPMAQVGKLPQNLPDHTTGSGKAFIVYNQNTIQGSTPYPGDGIIGKYFGAAANHNELYVRFYVRTQSGFRIDGSKQIKAFRVGHWRGTSNIFQWANESGPMYYYDLARVNTAYGGGNGYSSSFRCYPDYSYCSGHTIPNTLGANHNGGTITSLTSIAPNPVWADAGWHRIDYRFKMNTVGAANGVFTWWYDGVQVASFSNMEWKKSDASIGWNFVALGGNSNNLWASSPADQWYSIDDVVVSTTPIPDNYVIGGGTPVADTTAPTASITYPASNASLSGTVSVNATAADNIAVSKVELYVNNVLQSSDTTSPYVLSWNTASLANGTYSMLVKASDAAGNVGQSPAVAVTVSNSQTIDISAPTVAISAPTNNATVSGTVTVAASATDNVAVSKVEFYDNDTVFAVVNTAPHSVNLDTTRLVNGSHSFKSRAYDTTGNVGQSAAVAVTVNNQTQTQDVTAPTVSITSPASNATVSGNMTISASATDNVAIAKVEFYVNGALHNTDTSAPFSYGGATTSANNGTYALYAKAYDTAGNVKQSATVNFTINNGAAADTTVPTASIQAPTSSYVYGTSVAVKAGGTDNVAVKKTEIYIDGVLKASANASSLSWSWILSGYAKGSHTIMIKSYDAAGNVGTRSKTVTKL